METQGTELALSKVSQPPSGKENATSREFLPPFFIKANVHGVYIKGSLCESSSEFKIK